MSFTANPNPSLPPVLVQGNLVPKGLEYLAIALMGVAVMVGGGSIGWAIWWRWRWEIRDFLRGGRQVPPPHGLDMAIQGNDSHGEMAGEEGNPNDLPLARLSSGESSQVTHRGGQPSASIDVASMARSAAGHEGGEVEEITSPA
jgi:hypothetical protein